jgi:hypothetical protein
MYIYLFIYLFILNLVQLPFRSVLERLSFFTSLPALTAALASASPTSAAAAAQVQRAEFRRVVNVVGVERLGWLYTNLKFFSS